MGTAKPRGERPPGAVGGGPAPLSGETEVHIHEAEIIGFAEVANRSEIQRALAGLERASDPRVRDFAQRMLDEHREALRRLTDLVGRRGMPTFQGTTSENFLAESNRILASLRTEHGPRFDRAYLEAEIRGHQRVLQTLDDRWIVNVRDPELRSELARLREIFASHLEQARRLQAEIAPYAP